MIGVIAKTEEHDVVRELFELFKTPWEFHRRDRRYDAVLATGDADVRDARARLLIVYAGAPAATESRVQGTGPRRPSRMLRRRDGSRIPIYGDGIIFADGGDLLTDEGSGQAAAAMVPSNDGVVVRIGYDLFSELRTVLTAGQPPAQAGIPVVDAHIALLRDLLVEYAAPLIEIPPVPAGHPFIVCLTHDVDHASIRLHGWDHTMLGFVYRAVVGSLVNVLRGRIPPRDLWTNWLAVLQLPFIYLGLARDFWYDFDRYLEIDGGASTFFVIPFRDRPGRAVAAPAPARRAARYGASDIDDQIKRLVAAGAHVGVHGIDAWCDGAKGREELEQVSKITGDGELGVRMHWLYFDDASPALLEKAGFAYDSTMGYSETVGYRAGTTQVFKPLSAIRLLELPLHVMDTALFYPSRLDLSRTDATSRVRSLVDNALRHGGVLTVNWHDRSIAPERLWGEFYARLLDDLKRQGVWFATTAGAVAWFRRRRAAMLDVTTGEGGGLRAKVSVPPADGSPGLRLRVHQRRGVGAHAHVDIVVNESFDAALPLPETS